VKKILIIRFSSIGDIVLTTPVIRCLKKHLPESEVHYLTFKSYAEALRYNPYIDKLYAIESNELKKTTAELKKVHYDLIIDLHHNLRSLKIKAALGIPSHSFNKRNIEKWLLVNLNVNLLPSGHIVDRYMKAVEPLGVKYDGGGLDFFLTTADKVELNSLPAPWSSGFVAFVIGAKHATKRLPVEKIINTINEMRLPVILLGGPEDVSRGELIASGTNGYSFNACGRYNLLQSASVVKASKAVITHDTGLMHIAAAFQQRILSVWGNTVPSFGMYPYLSENSPGQSIIFENNNLTCRPCSKIGFEKCPKKHFNCMNEIDTSAIARQANEWWNSK
jgi:ADP-heptose:LPS heptosyltransferase